MPLRILFVTPYVPSRLRTRPFGFLRALATRGHALSLVSAASSAAEAAQASDLRPWCERMTVVRVSPLRSLWNSAAGLAGDLPLQALYSQSPVLSAAVREEAGRGVDLMHVEHLRAARLGLENPGLPRVFDAVDCITDLFAHAARAAATRTERWRARLDLERTRRYEGWLWRQFDAALVTSEADRATLAALPAPAAPDPPPLAVIPNGVDLDYFSPADVPRNGDEIVFVGRMSYHANVAAAQQLIEAILPAVRRSRPSTRVTIVGANPTASVRALARHEGVEVTGGVDDVRPYLRRAALAVCPLVYAAGIQNKVLEAMACATPVITSPGAAAALGARAGQDLSVAADAPAFAREILRLLADAGTRERLGAAGRAHALARHDWNWVVGALEELYQDALARFRRGPG